MDYIKNLYSGRIGRKNYILGYFVFTLPLLVLYFSLFSDTETADLFSTLYIIPYLLVSFYVYALMVRRLHDIGKNGWFIFLMAIPFVGVIYFFILLFKKSQPIVNKYGEVPDKNKKFLDDILNRKPLSNQD